MPLPPFHLAIPVHDLAAARSFYGDLFGCPEGRSTDVWIDFNFFGHQLVCHRTGEAAARGAASSVDGHAVPIPHFGIVLDMATWERLAERLRADGAAFVVEPQVRFRGEPGEQAVLFVRDPSGNVLEFKAFADVEGQLFAK